MKPARRLLFVDGYNIIRSTDLYRDIEVEDYTDGAAMNPVRQRLVADVAAYAQGRYEATVVFDGGGNVSSTGEPLKMAGIEVIFSPTGLSADSVIEILATKARDRGCEVFVVTSDQQTQWTVLGDRVTRISAAAFAHEVGLVNQSVKEHNPSRRVKNTLSERIDPAVAAKLAEMVRPKRK